MAITFTHSGVDLEAILQEKVRAFPEHVNQLKQFFTGYTKKNVYPHEIGQFNNRVYMNQLFKLKTGQSNSLRVSLDDLYEEFGNSKGPSLWDALLTNATRYIQLIYEASDYVINEDKELHQAAMVDNDQDPTEAIGPKVIDPGDITREHYMRNGFVPAYLRSNYTIQITPPTLKDAAQSIPICSMRDVHADTMGHLTRMRADVTRTTQVKPRIEVAAYECDHCHKHVFQAVPGSSFLPLSDCPGCASQIGHKSTLKMNIRLSKFTNHQEVKVQEQIHHVPEGDVPRSMTCIVLGKQTRKLLPGMSTVLTGILVAEDPMGYGIYKGSLITERKFYVYHIQDENVDEDLEINPDHYKKQIQDLMSQDNYYEKLATDIAPEIWGHTDIKKALLLQLIGGAETTKSDGGTVRGNIHILLMGDPGVAKSQLMKKLCSIHPRAVYATGKGSSNAGLTAAVIRDPNTGEATLEGGAFVLADRGLCCVDEFDKMDEYDRSAIYEVMEQQTVSIAKAGHCCSIPARTSILAAANPVGGRYDIRKTLFANMNLSAALLSRFDLQFLTLDRPNREVDMRLAKHIIGILREKPVGIDDNPISKKLLMAFVNDARKRTPVLGDLSIETIVSWYANARQAERQSEVSREDTLTYTTPRAMLAVLRLSQAMARLRHSSTINESDFDEALRLMEVSKQSVKQATESAIRKPVDISTRCFDHLKRLKRRYALQQNWDGWIPISDLETHLESMGYKRRVIERSLGQYEELGVLLWDTNRRKIGFPEDIRPDDTQMVGASQ